METEIEIIRNLWPLNSGWISKWVIYSCAEGSTESHFNFKVSLRKSDALEYFFLKGLWWYASDIENIF